MNGIKSIYLQKLLIANLDIVVKNFIRLFIKKLLTKTIQVKLS